MKTYLIEADVQYPNKLTREPFVVSAQNPDAACHKLLKEKSNIYHLSEPIELPQPYSAAPEILEALMNIENDDNSIPAPIWTMIQNAIKKATL